MERKRPWQGSAVGVPVRHSPPMQGSKGLKHGPSRVGRARQGQARSDRPGHADRCREKGGHGLADWCSHGGREQATGGSAKTVCPAAARLPAEQGTREDAGRTRGRASLRAPRLRVYRRNIHAFAWMLAESASGNRTTISLVPGDEGWPEARRAINGSQPQDGASELWRGHIPRNEAHIFVRRSDEE